MRSFTSAPQSFDNGRSIENLLSMQQAFVGRSVPRLEDKPLVTGLGRFVADIGFPHQLHMHVVRSTHAHGRISSIDVQAALAHLGIAAVWTSNDVADIPPIDF